MAAGQGGSDGRHLIGKTPGHNWIHGLGELRETWYHKDVNALIESGKLPEAIQRLTNGYMEIFERQPTYNEVTEPLFRRLAFKLGFCSICEQFFISNPAGAFKIRRLTKVKNDQGELAGSYLLNQYKTFSESAARDYERLELLPGDNSNDKDLALLIQEMAEQRKKKEIPNRRRGLAERIRGNVIP